MGFDFSYMGTKRQLAPTVAEVISGAKPGPVMDVFSGMCAVGAAVGECRPVWNNDIQEFCATVAMCLFRSEGAVPTPDQADRILFTRFEKNRATLMRRFEHEVLCESRALNSRSHQLILLYRTEQSPSRVLGHHRLERRQRSLRRHRFPFCLFSLTYADTYFGLRQCIEIDSLIYAIVAARSDGLISDDEQRWMLIVLGDVLKNVATTTGHFAQFLEPNSENAQRFVQQRIRSVWSEFLHSLTQVSPLGTSEWRASNKVYNLDTLRLLEQFTSEADVPSVVYADPPYTDDQYSRYYHVLETLIRYDYPETASKGQYRPDRFRTPFSVKTEVRGAFDRLIRSTGDFGAELVLSYPTNGLLHKCGSSPLEYLTKYYPRVEVCNAVSHTHSTFGASKGVAQASVTEMIYYARN